MRALNRTALRHLKSLKSAQFYICEPVLTEACFHLPALSQRTRLQQIIEQLGVMAVSVDDVQSLWNEVFEWLSKYSDHEPDWADGYLAVLCGRGKAYKVWTYDVEFRTTWRKPNGSAIPMAVKV